MAWFRKRPDAQTPNEQESSTATDPALGGELRAMIDRLAVACVAITLGSPTEDHRRSCLGGHAALPPGTDWPSIGGRPALFVCQLSFADIPELPGFPRRGLLQWFVADDETFGLSFDETAGTTGFAVRWYDDPALESQQPPTAVPPSAGDPLALGFDAPPATELHFTAGRCLPAWTELPDSVRSLELWSRVAAANGEDAGELEFTYDEYVRGASSPATDLVQTSKLGGSPDFVQQDVRGSGQYSPAGTAAGTLLVELNGDDVGGWGDAGIGHLFGDPGRIAVGDFSSVRYHWDCG